MKTHRTLLKRLINPILRRLGYSIVSVISDNNEFIRYELRPYPENCAKIPPGGFHKTDDR